jgi:hypothetical protein
MATGTPRAGTKFRIMVDTSSAGTGSAVTLTSKGKVTVDQSVQTYETTSGEDLNRTYVVGLPDAKGTIEGQWDSADNNAYNLYGSTVPRKFYFYPDAADNIGSYLFGTAYFGAKMDVDVKSPVNQSFDWNAASACAWVHP